MPEEDSDTKHLLCGRGHLSSLLACDTIYCNWPEGLPSSCWRPELVFTPCSGDCDSSLEYKFIPYSCNALRPSVQTAASLSYRVSAELWTSCSQRIFVLILLILRLGNDGWIQRCRRCVRHAGTGEIWAVSYHLAPTPPLRPPKERLRFFEPTRLFRSHLPTCDTNKVALRRNNSRAALLSLFDVPPVCS